MKLLQAIRNNTPNAITCLNLLCGALAIVVAFKPFDTVLWGLQGYQLAFVLIALAAVADFCDGLMARLLHAVSPLGKELDSLSDCVSFGLSPALILYNVMVAAGCDSWVCLMSMMIPVFGALRLARFNVDTNQATTFTGLPIPANAIFWIGFINYYASHHTVSQWIVLALIVALSLLMVCNLRMFSLKLHGFSLKESYRQLVLVIASVVFIVLAGVSGLACVIAFYVLMSLLLKEKE
ncbi:MAG: CDP-diacylglycerol--serine O-phosphatidyltransferase [Muribaculaceae bacterium]|nr:CDP-diacylglycerol--serine O-phosphatidyltransferase [Muribaculaceae bacterium]MBQ2562683.1 CDP-diacylglycerol--serine O-phosphatidyltransferase [Muribaculaceae bacterium]MBQ5408450.1 CDP-diacylglycerol--serine O-phosphatidyltransferase [Muribaculaceae bacterium]MBQ5508375.1 CDP-diacylglycerol--serine O-phosphatidyltransferase [Muribaculaceae bacterium]